MNSRLELAQLQTRRHFLRDSQLALGGIALASLTGGSTTARAEVVNPLAPRAPHHPAKAKHVIYLHLTGSPPHLDLYDYKPELVKRDGQPCPDEFLKGKRFAFTTGVPKLLGTPR
ncbi:MAG: sulfatase, partial [Planctomycetota bacterium]